MIDGKELEFTKGQTILEVANKADIYIPTLCYLEGLEGYGGCRLCLCKVEGNHKFLPACTTPAHKGMVVVTKNEELQEIRREIIKLILSEHPHSCLICESKEECEIIRPSLQKAGRTFGCFSCPNKQECEIREIIEYLQIEDIEHELFYKNYPLKRNDPFLEKDYNLCIVCGRCVRICNELRGIGAINFINRGHNTQVSTILDLPSIDTNCQFCGACIDVCPTGALSSKNTKWNIEFSETSTSICGFCSVGCGFKYYSAHGELMESLPDENNPTTHGQACLVGRFCTSQFNNGKERLKHPSYKINNNHIPTDWSNLYEKIANRLHGYSSDEIAVLVSPNLTNESSYLLQKFANEVLHTKNVFVPLEEQPIQIFYEQLTALLNIQNYHRPFQSIENSNLIILVNADVQLTHPPLLIQLHKAKKNGATIISLNLAQYKLPSETTRLLDYELNITFKELISFILHLSNSFIKNSLIDTTSITNYPEFISWLDSSDLISSHGEFAQISKTIVSSLKDTTDFKGIILFGMLKMFSESFIRDLLGALFNLMILTNKKVSLIPLWRRGNSEGVYQSVFHNPNTSLTPSSQIFNDISSGKIKALYLTERLNNRALLKKPELVILQDVYSSDDLMFADFILPACTFLEESGSYITSESRLQNLTKSTDVKGDAKPDWAIFKELALEMDEKLASKFNYKNVEDIFSELTDFNPFLKRPFHEQQYQEDKDLEKTLYIIDSDKEYPRPYIDVFTQKSFAFRGEEIYRKVADFKTLIEYRSEKAHTVEPDTSGLEEPSKAPFKILRNEEIAPNFFELVIEAPLIARKARPSSFIIIMMNEKSERIPLTLSDWDEKKGTITVIYQETGFSTRELAEKKQGDRLFSVVGPLGKEIELNLFGTVLLGGGCYGIGAIYPIARKLKELGNRVIVILEARNQALFYFEDKFNAVSDEVIYCTSDGSKGLKGKIDTGINHVLQREITIDRCHFIGCNVMMMKACTSTMTEGQIPTFVNLNTIMIDGTGMCGGCRVSLKEEGKPVTRFACVDGPTFDGHLVNWEELLSRSERLSFSESKIFQTHTCRALENLNTKKVEENNE